jgi:hypothetical protein
MMFKTTTFAFLRLLPMSDIQWMFNQTITRSNLNLHARFRKGYVPPDWHRTIQC